MFTVGSSVLLVVHQPRFWNHNVVFYSSITTRHSLSSSWKTQVTSGSNETNRNLHLYILLNPFVHLHTYLDRGRSEQLHQPVDGEILRQFVNPSGRHDKHLLTQRTRYPIASVRAGRQSSEAVDAERVRTRQLFRNGKFDKTDRAFGQFVVKLA